MMMTNRGIQGRSCVTWPSPRRTLSSSQRGFLKNSQTYFLQAHNRICCQPTAVDFFAELSVTNRNQLKQGTNHRNSWNKKWPTVTNSHHLKQTATKSNQLKAIETKSCQIKQRVLNWNKGLGRVTNRGWLSRGLEDTLAYCFYSPNWNKEFPIKQRVVNWNKGLGRETNRGWLSRGLEDILAACFYSRRIHHTNWCCRTAKTTLHHRHYHHPRNHHRHQGLKSWTICDPP